MADEYVDPFGSEPPDPQKEGRTRLEPETPSEPPSPAGLVRASSLLPQGYDEDEGDFEPGGRYKGFVILPPAEWPSDLPEAHGRAFPRRFYVLTPMGKVGLVPWPGSQITWPWEAGWQADLHREQVESFLKDEKKEKR